MSDECCGTCQESCPEQADVTLVDQTINISPLGSLVVTLIDKSPPVANRKLVHIEIQDDDGDPVDDMTAEVLVRFVDDPTNGATQSVSPPPIPGWPTAFVQTEDGEVDIEVGNDGALQTWYAVVVLGGGPVVSPAITLGI